MNRLITLAVATLILAGPAYAQQQDAREIAQERAAAENEVPHLVKALGL